MKKLMMVLATILASGAATFGFAGPAHANIFYCSSTRNGNVSVTSICEGITAGGNQHQRAWIQCKYGIWVWKTFYGPTVGVFQYSTAYAAAGGVNCFGGYETRP